MSEIPPIQVSALPPPVAAGSQRTPASSPEAGSGAPVDEVEISEQGQRLSALDAGPEPRSEKVARLRAAIQDGSYDPDAKIEQILDRLLGVLRQAG